MPKLDNLRPAAKPTLFMLGGQPGAGKSTVRQAILASRKGNGALVVDPDELRIYHPRYLEYVEADPDNAASMVQVDAVRWAQELRREAISRKVNIVYDGTLANRGDATGMAGDAHRSGYQIEVHVIATPLAISKLNVRKRFEEARAMPAPVAPPRNVPEDVQERSYEAIPGTLEMLSQLGVVSRICISSQSGDRLSDVVGKTRVKEDGSASATSALKEERARDWTEQELAEFEQRSQETEKIILNRIRLLRGFRDLGPDLEAELEADRILLRTLTKTREQVCVQKRPGAAAIRKKQDAWIQATLGIAVS